jgi:hypothetical protein
MIPWGVAKVPTNIVNFALDHIKQFTSPLGTNGLPTDPELWHGVKLAPDARPIYELAIGNGATPAYYEFKVVVAAPITFRSKGGFIGRQSSPLAVADTQYGYILVSASEDDSPVVEFSTQGRRPSDQLADRAGTTEFKAFRFGSTFYTAEDGAGNILASYGSQPYKVDKLPDASQAQFTDAGDSETGGTNRMTAPKPTVVPFQSYEEFRNDYVNHPVFQQMRTQRVTRARARWGIERGITLFPQVVVRVGATISETNRAAIRSVSLVSEDSDLARVSFNARNPNVVTITGGQVGTGTIVIIDTTGTNHLTLSVVAPIRPSGDPFMPGWRTKKVYYAGTWDQQPKFYQLKRDEWCPYVGCGPVAWGMLFAWFEVNKQIPGAFGDPFAFDVGLTMDEYAKSYIDTWRSLHNFCDTMCFAVSDAGATLPGDMIDGGFNYLFFPKTMGLIKYNYAYQWNFWSSGTYAMDCRDAVANGYPAVVGLGWLWHYALAYGVAYQEFELAPGVFAMSRRILKCNMGFGAGEGPRWYDMDDTFLGARIHVMKGPLADSFPPLN